MPWLGRGVGSPIIKSAKLKPNSFKASTQEEIPRKNLFKKEEVSWKYPLVISLINDWKYLPLFMISNDWISVLLDLWSASPNHLLQMDQLVDNWTIDLLGLKLRLEKSFSICEFWRQQMKFNMGGLVIGRTRGGQLKWSKGPLPAGWSVSVYPQKVDTV